jgi:uncharacterized repeat protein (TIGR01451 family)
MRGWVLRHCSLTGAGLMLGACLLVSSGRVYGQREIIATASAAPPETPAAPRIPPAAAPASPPRTIQQVAFVPDAAPSNAPQGNQAMSQPLPAAMVPPSALLSGLANSPSPVPSVGRTGGMPVPPMPPKTGGTPMPPMTGGTLMPPSVLSVEVVGPDRHLLGQPLTHEIVLRNLGGQTIAEMHVEEPLPADARVLKADPPAVKNNNRLAWDLHHLEAGGERHLKVELEPGSPGELNLRPYATFQVDNGLRTQVMRPPFSIDISADRAQAMRGERIRFRIQLANRGDAPIRNIKIYDTLPPGLHHPRGPKLGVHFGDLLPGETKSIPLETTAVESGPIHNEIVAQADRGLEAKGAVDVVVAEPNLSLKLDGPTQTATQRELDFHLEVANPAALTAKNVRLVQTLPPSFEIVAANGATLDNNLHALTWSLTDLGAGQRQRVTFRIKTNDGGDWPMTAAVLSQNFPEARVSRTLHAVASAILKLEVHAREEHLSQGAETVVSIHVFNKGGAACAGVRLTATLPECVVPFKAEGPQSGQIEKQQVYFAPLDQLDAHGDVVYSLHVRGRQAGKGPLRVELTAEKHTPADKEISIQVDAAGETATAATTKAIPGETLR